MMIYRLAYMYEILKEDQYINIAAYDPSAPGRGSIIWTGRLKDTPMKYAADDIALIVPEGNALRIEII